MKFTSLVKRIAPFALTFAVGLFIASFFVTVAAPSFQFRRGMRNHREMDRQMRIENQQLREENNRLQNRLAEMEKRDWVLESGPASMPDLPTPPQPPAPPKVVVIPMQSVPSKAR
jgi:hypothetical protein